MLVRNNHRRIARAAFTLMEMMVVVAIIVVLGGIAVVAYQNFSDRGNEAKAASVVKQLDEALLYYQLENKVWPESLEALITPDIYGNIYIKNADALKSPWQGTTYQVDLTGANNMGTKPDVWIVHPSGRYLFGNWNLGEKIPTGGMGL